MEKLEDKTGLLAGVVVFVLSAIVFVPVLWGTFLNWDDNVLFLENPHFRGLGAEHWQWMCTTFFYGHWQPLSWLSYALDYVAWGLAPLAWHATNWLLHSVNAVLVFLLCRSFQKKPANRASLLAAMLASALYAVHPLRVETVAWLSTRGYLLGTGLCLLSVLFYMRAVRREHYPFWALLFFTAAALTKGICMMIPLVLLLIDWFPLRCIASIRTAIMCFVEKIPFLCLSLLTGGMAFWAKSAAGGMASIKHHGISERIVQAVYGIWFYIFKGISPQQLSPLYCKRPGLDAMILSFVLTTAVAVLLFIFRRRIKALLVGFGSAFLLIFPMIGITQSGSQLFADRFTYLAAIPIAVLLAVGLERLVRFRKPVIIFLFGLVLVFSFQSVVWCGSWQNDLALWESALSVDEKNPQAWNSAGLALKQRGEYQKARVYFTRAVQLNLGYVQAWHNRALVSALLEEYELAEKYWKIALALPSSSPRDRLIIHWTRGWIFEQRGNIPAALKDYNFAINQERISEENRAAVLLLRAKLYLKEGDHENALADLRWILKMPDAFGTRHAEAKELISQMQ